MHSKIVITLLCMLSWEVLAQDAFKDFLIQSPKMDKPQRGTLKGDFAELGANALNERSGSFLIDLPLVFPTDRGSMQLPYKVSYSAGFGFSEYGIGLDTSLRINRFRELGKINYSNNDDLMSPWGQLTAGNDGFWYSKDLRNKIKGKIEDNNFFIYMPNGVVATFGDDTDPLYTEKNSSNQIHGWYLKETRDPSGHVTSYIYKKFQTDGKSYLDKIAYGGFEDDFQYQLALTYEKIDQDFTDYSLGRKLVKNRRVTKLSVQFKSGSTFSTRYYYNFLYSSSSTSPNFYLSSMQKFYSETAYEPAVQFTYDLPSSFLNNAQWVREPLLDSLANTYRGLLTNLNHSSLQDFNNDGITDIEVGKSYQEFRNNNGNFVEITRPAPTGAVSNWCLFPVYNDRKPRKFIQLHQDNTAPYVFDFFTYNSKNLLEVCSLNGERVATIEFPYFWEYGQKTIFADLNDDGLSDVIHLRGDAYEVSYNTSSRNSDGPVSFATPSAPVQINLPSDYGSFWVKDINGDGNADLVLKGTSTIYVHHGHSDGSFEKNYKTFDFYAPNGAISSKDLADSQVTWIDVNKDALPDILLQGDGFITLHLNSGSGFINKPMPGLFVNPQLYQNMIIGNLTGAGDTQILSSVINGGENIVLKLDLDRPSLGLMTSLYDGKGNELLVEYKKAGVQAGISSRKTIISKMIQKVVGKTSITYNFGFSSIKKNTVNNNFLGFQNIENTQDSLGRTITNYTYDSRNLHKQTSKLKFDFNHVDFINYEESQFTDFTIANITSPMLTKKITGTRNNSGSAKTQLVTEFDYDESKLCLLNEVKSSSSQTFSKQTTYYEISDIEDHLDCFEKEIRISGSGSSSIENYVHKMELVRDGQARVIEVKKGVTDISDFQNIVYGSNGLIQAVTEAGKGTSTFHYDSNYRLNKVINADLTENLIGSFTSMDQPLVMNSKRGAITLVNDFRYDNLYRLTKTWDNLGGFSESNPATSYNYIYGNKLAPAKVFEEARIEKTAGSFGTNGKVFLMTGSGEELASAIETDDNFKIQGLSQFKPNLGITSKVKDYLVDDDFDFSNMQIADLNFGELKLSNSINDFLGNVRNVEQAIQNGVLKTTANDFTVSSGFTTATTMVNSSSNLVTEKKTNEFGYQASFKDEENNSYSFLNDSLGRVREIIFPDGVKQSVVYDSDTGSISKVERDNLGKIEYTYNTSTMLLSEKRRYDRLGDLKLKENYSYDAIGRVLTKTMLKINDDGSDGSATAYNYSYDGLNLTSSERIGQEGFLTGVSTTSYAKAFIYREDGKILESKLTIPGFREFRTIMTYMSHGEIASRRQIVKNLTDNSIEADYILSNEYDRLGRLQKLKKDSSLFAELSYNSFSQVDTIEISGHKEIKYLYDGLTRQSQDYKETQGSSILFQQQWNLNNRGLISNDKFTFGTREVEKDYSYSSRGFLSGMSRDDSSGPTLTTSYGYGNQGLMTGESLDGVAKTHTMGLTNWDIGGVTYGIDTLGRVISKGIREFEYGENGRISRVNGIGIDEATYVYDEENNPLLKNYIFGKIEVYLDNNAYVEDHLYEPVKLGLRTIGYLKDGAFVNSSQDHINTNVINENGNVSLSTPYGERTSRSEVNYVLDYTLKGYDKEIDAVRMGHRYYDSTSKRFISQDDYFLENSDKVIKSPIEGNLYSYAGNDPVKNTDPTGKCLDGATTVLCGAGVGMVIGAATEALTSTKTGSEYTAGIRDAALVGATTGALAVLTGGQSLLATGAISAGGTAYKLAMDKADLTSSASQAKIGVSFILGAATSGASRSLPPKVADNALSAGLSMIENFTAGTAEKVIDKVEQVQTQQQKENDRLDQLRQAN